MSWNPDRTNHVSPEPLYTTGVIRNSKMSLQMEGAKLLSRSSKQLFRDCLRLIQHIAGRSKKAQQLQIIVGKEFRKNKSIEDPAKIEALKSNAIRALANYLMLESSAKDKKFSQKSSIFTEKEAESIRGDRDT